MVLRIVGI